MPETKACNLTEEEIRQLIEWHGYSFDNAEDIDARIERINYLNKRLKAFKEEAPKTTADAINAAGAGQQQLQSPATGWPTNG